MIWFTLWIFFAYWLEFWHNRNKNCAHFQLHVWPVLTYFSWLIVVLNHSNVDACMPPILTRFANVRWRSTTTEQSYSVTLEKFSIFLFCLKILWFFIQPEQQTSRNGSIFSFLLLCILACLLSYYYCLLGKTLLCVHLFWFTFTFTYTLDTHSHRSRDSIILRLRHFTRNTSHSVSKEVFVSFPIVFCFIQIGINGSKHSSCWPISKSDRWKFSTFLWKNTWKFWNIYNVYAFIPCAQAFAHTKKNVGASSV